MPEQSMIESSVTQEFEESHLPPEQKLWAAVILRAVQDLCNSYDPAEKSQKSMVALERNDALRWFRRGGKDFKQVCSMAGMDPSYVRGKVLGMLDGQGN